MNDYRLDAAFSKLAAHVPKAPEESVELMAKTVAVLNEERVRRGIIPAEPELEAAAMEQELAPQMQKEDPGRKL